METHRNNCPSLLGLPMDLPITEYGDIVLEQRRTNKIGRSVHKAK